MSQLPRRANTFCGCCSDAQKYAINSISQAIRLQASKGREEYAGGERIGLPSHAVKSKIPPLLASWSKATTFRSTWQLSLFVIFCVALLQLLPPSCHKSSHPPQARPGCHIAATSYVWLMCRQAGKGWHRKRIQRAANVASECYVPSRPDRKSCASFSKVPFTLLLTL